jgi:hypothetical protein
MACLGSALVGLTEALTLDRRAIAPAIPQDAPFRMLTASSGAAAIFDGFGRPFEFAASFDEISFCDAILAGALQPDKLKRG